MEIMSLGAAVCSIALVWQMGLVLGWLLGRRWPFVSRAGAEDAEPRASDPPAPSPRELRDAAQQLAQHVADVQRDVHEHQGRIEQVSAGLQASQAQPQDAVASSVLNSVADILRINAQLQGRLLAAEGKLQEQGKQIESCMLEARTDPLTGLLNRRAFDDALIRQIAEWNRKQVPFSLIMIDADHFKAINDQHGHAAGDVVLQGLSDQIEGNLRKMDLVARVGGEEFAVILPGTSGRDACRAAEHCRRAIGQHVFYADDRELRMTVSLGVSAILAGDTAEDLLRRADQAMYASKKGGRNCIHLHSGKTCEFIGPLPHALEESKPRAVRTVAAADRMHETLDPEWAAVCGQLQDRLAEVLPPQMQS